MMQRKPQPELSDAQREWLRSSPALPSEITVTSNQGQSSSVYKVLERNSLGQVTGIEKRMGRKGFVLKVEDISTGAIYAAKLCVPEDYDEQRTEFVETKLASKLYGSDGLFVIPIIVGRVDSFDTMPGNQTEFVCFISEWITGDTLEQMCEKGEGIDPSFICEVTLQILKATQFLEKRSLKHDDLHLGNVMIRNVNPDLALIEDEKKLLKLSIIDMGSLKHIEQETEKSKDDNLSLVKIMTKLYNIIWNQRRLATSYPTFISDYARIISQMCDDDIGRHFPSHESLPKALMKLGDNLDSGQYPIPERPFHPFEAISAEHLADDATLLSLFENSLPWFSSVLEPKPILLSGPRGCGKSMLFRYMAARTHIPPEQNADTKLDNLNFFGVYISCATYLQNNLMWITRKPGRANQFAESISTFFQLVVLRELLRSIASAHKNKESRRRYELTDTGIDELISFISSYFNEPIETSRLTHQFKTVPQ